MFQLRTLSEHQEASIFKIQELKMKIGEIVDEQKSSAKSINNFEQEVRSIFLQRSVFDPLLQT